MDKEELKLNDEELHKCIDELKGTKFLSAFCILDWIIKTRNENEELKKQATIMERYLELINELRIDNEDTIEGLEELINELKRLACLGRVCNVTETIYVYNNKAYNILHQILEKDED